MKQIRGIRNNNPANIRRGASWKGLVPFLVDHTNNQRFYDKQFCQFENVIYGIRALLVLLRTYHYRYHLNTISQVIHRFAPLSENNTYAYIANVVRFLDDSYKMEIQDFIGDCITSDSVLCWFNNPKSPTFACKELAKAICRQESGYPLTDCEINDAIKLL